MRLLALAAFAGCGGRDPIGLFDAAPRLDSRVGGCGFARGGEVKCEGCSVLTQMGCATGQKCTWVRSTDPVGDVPGLGANECAPDGDVAAGGACTTLPAGSGGFDDCHHGTQCVDHACEAICDSNDGTPACGAGQACVTHDGLFANSGATTVPAGVCEPSCDPLDDNDFDGAGSAFAKSGSACGSDPVIGCYGTFPIERPASFHCARPTSGTETLTHRSVVPIGKQTPTSCMSGYAIPFAQDATGSSNVDCYAYCRPGDAYLGAASPTPNGVAPHRCNTTDARGAFGVPATATTNGEHCVFSWFFEVDSAGLLHRSPTSDTVGICWDHTQYKYDANGDGTPDTTIEACGALPLVQPAGSTAPSAVTWSCVSTATAQLPSGPLHRPYIDGMPHLEAPFATGVASQSRASPAEM